MFNKQIYPPHEFWIKYILLKVIITDQITAEFCDKGHTISKLIAAFWKRG